MYWWWSMPSSRIQLCWPKVSAMKQPSSTSSGSEKCRCSRSQKASSSLGMPQAVARHAPGDRLGIGQRCLLPVVVAVGALEVQQLVVLHLLDAGGRGFCERWLPQNSHLTVREM